MERAVLDSSALIAVYLRESGYEAVLQLLPDSVMSAVNAAEAQQVLIRKGSLPNDAWRLVLSGVARIASFDAQQARICGELASVTSKAGLSAGDRACLALATVLKLPVYTADRAWLRMDAGIDVRLIR